MMELRIEKLFVELGKNEILHDICLSVAHGELATILGSSGCGKTTLLRTIAGLTVQKSGDIFIADRCVNKLPPQSRNAVIVFQDLRLFPHLSVEKNIAFAPELRKKTKEWQRMKVQELLELVQLAGFEKRRIQELSGGQLQRVALARALACEPSLLLLDEPFSGLDENLREEMALLLRRLQKNCRITTLLVTHDPSEALRLSDKLVLMDGGRILQTGSPYDLFYRPSSAFVASRFGKINDFDGKLLRPTQLRPVRGNGCRIEDIAFLGEQVEITLHKCLEPEKKYYCKMLAAEFFQKEFRVGDTADLAEIAYENIDHHPIL